MAIDYGWIGLHQTARILEMPVVTLIDGLFEKWAPPHEFTKDFKVRFRWADVWEWKMHDGWGVREFKQQRIYGS